MDPRASALLSGGMVVVAVAACGEDPAAPTIVRVEPAIVSPAAVTPARIVGQHFHSGVTYDLGADRAEEGTAFVVEVGDVLLDASSVSLASTTELRVQLPAGLPLGTHPVTVTTPEGRTARLDDALTVALDIGEGGSGGAGAQGGQGGQGGALEGGGGTGGQGPSTMATCPGVLQDDFDGTALDTSEWDLVGPAQHTSVAGGLLSFSLETPHSDWIGVASTASYDVRDCAVWARIPSVADDGWMGFSYFSLYHPMGSLSFEIRDTEDLFMKYGFDQDMEAYDPAKHAWLRFRHAADTVYWESSPDGTVWTTLREMAAPSHLDAMTIAFGIMPGTGPSSGVTSIDAVNVAP